MSLEITTSLIEEAMKLPEVRPRSGREVLALPNARPAGVLLPLRLEPVPHVLAMIRSRKMREHAGEVGFPGGKNEAGESLLVTALREAEEELGLARHRVRPLGSLQPVSVITGRFVIHPYVAILDRDQPVVPCAQEVERVLELPILPWLSGEMPIHAVEVNLDNATEPAGAFGSTPVSKAGVLQLPHFQLDGCVLYGASAYVFHELLVRIATASGHSLPPPRLQKELPWTGRYGV